VAKKVNKEEESDRGLDQGDGLAGGGGDDWIERGYLGLPILPRERQPDHQNGPRAPRALLYGTGEPLSTLRERSDVIWLKLRAEGGPASSIHLLSINALKSRRIETRQLKGV
jgi:hypothetical protein